MMRSHTLQRPVSVDYTKRSLPDLPPEAYDNKARRLWATVKLKFTQMRTTSTRPKRALHSSYSDPTGGGGRWRPLPGLETPKDNGANYQAPGSAPPPPRNSTPNDDKKSQYADCENGQVSEASSSSNNNQDYAAMYIEVVKKPQIPRLTQVLFNLYKQGWYWGPLSREETEEKLQSLPKGSFLVRDSSDDRHFLTLSFKTDARVLHSRIEYIGGQFSFHSLPSKQAYKTVEELITQSMDHTRNGTFTTLRVRNPIRGQPDHTVPINLLHPVSRLTEVRSLLYLCRFVVRQHIRLDGIDDLSLPETVKEYVAEKQY